jgi:hypothetical protein
MDDIDEFLNSIEDTPSTEKVASGTVKPENDRTAPLDAELEALFDDFHTMLGTGADQSLPTSASTDPDTGFHNTSEPEELTRLDIDQTPSKTEGARYNPASPARF